MASRGLPVLWFSVASVLVLYDSLFVFLRPRTMPGGDLHYIWSPYDLYTGVDTAYADMENEFTIAQSWLNLAEIVLNVIAIVLLLKDSKVAILVGFTVSVMTFWKTMLYMIQYTDLCGGAHLIAHVDWKSYIFLFLIPNGVWIVAPLYLSLSFGAEIATILQGHKVKRN